MTEPEPTVQVPVSLIERLMMAASDFGMRDEEAVALAYAAKSEHLPLIPTAEPQDHDLVSPVDGTTWVERNDGWQHVDVLDREVRLRRSRFHGLMVGVDGHWAYVGDEEGRMRDYLTAQSTQAVEPSWSDAIAAARVAGHDVNPGYDMPATAEPGQVGICNCGTARESHSLEDHNYVDMGLPSAKRCCDRPGDPDWHTVSGGHVVPPDVEEDTGHRAAEPPRIEDMAPGTTFTASYGRDLSATTRWMRCTGPSRCVNVGGVRFNAAAIDPSTIRDVTPPAVTE